MHSSDETGCCKIRLPMDFRRVFHRNHSGFWWKIIRKNPAGYILQQPRFVILPFLFSSHTDANICISVSVFPSSCSCHHIPVSVFLSARSCHHISVSVFLSSHSCHHIPVIVFPSDSKFIPHSALRQTELHTVWHKTRLLQADSDDLPSQ